MLYSILPSPANILISAFSLLHSKRENAKDTNRSSTQTHLPPQWEEAADMTGSHCEYQTGAEPRKAVHPLGDSDSKAPHPPPQTMPIFFFQ